MPKIYEDLAEWFPLITAPESYAEEAALYRRLLTEACDRPPVTALELGSGGGNNASHLKAHWQLTLTDVSPAMLAVSRALNPECEHIEGDMRTLRLGRTFDVVFVHDAVDYMTTEADLRAAMETAFIHCRPGGAVLFAPDHTRENFRESTDEGGHDGDRRSARYLEWTRDPDPSDTQYSTDYAFLLLEGDNVRVVHDRHVGGLFSREDWIRWLVDAGFDVSAAPLVHSEVEPGSQELFICKRPVGD
ncbi:MAG: class I SAM-dependent methyltransferase [Dehalococcoidia bacterium]